MHRGDGPQGHENQKIAPFIVPYTRGRGLDLGCGVKKTFPHFLSVDIGTHNGFPIAEMCADATKLREIFKDASQDFVFSSHLLEHLVDAEGALSDWWNLIRPGGHLVLYLPHEDFYPKVGQPHANIDHKHDLSPQKVRDWMEAVAHASGHGWTLLEDEVRDQGDGLEPLSEYSFFQVYRKAEKPKRPHQSIRCLEQPWRRREDSCLVVRYGAFGDHMMASSALAALKEQGWHITYNCEPRGLDLMREDPNIDAFLVQDNDQVPNRLLDEYWRRLEERYPLIFNLSESIEGELLAIPGRFNHRFPAEVRRRVMGTVNYLDRTHDRCAVPREPKRPAFYPDAKELNWAHKEFSKAKRLNRGHRLNEYAPVILWAMAGSSKHKLYPHMDVVIAALMAQTEATVVLVGNEFDKVLEVGWEDHERVWCRAGEWTIRQTLAFAQRCDIVVGPETGVLNAVSMDPEVAKVVYLSHSSHENLTRDWVNASVLEPDVATVSCYPCHRLHYGGWEHCRRHPETGVAACATSIPPEVFFGVIKDLLPQSADAAA